MCLGEQQRRWKGERRAEEMDIYENTRKTTKRLPTVSADLRISSSLRRNTVGIG
jgi:hypothetical protein